MNTRIRQPETILTDLEILHREVMLRIAELGTGHAARLMGVDPAMASRVKNGSQPLAPPTLVKWAKGLGVS